jgi:hypothetical protein
VPWIPGSLGAPEKSGRASLLCSGSTRTLKVGNVLLKIPDVLPQSMPNLPDKQRAVLQMLAASARGGPEIGLFGKFWNSDLRTIVVGLGLLEK